MALLPNINVGTSPNDGTGSSLRDAFIIVNENFQLIEAFFPNSNVANLTANIQSTGTSTFNYVNANVVYSSIFGNAGALYYGNIATAAQPNITSLGNLSSLIVSGTLTSEGATTLTGNLSTSAGHTIQGAFSIPPFTLTSNSYAITSTDTVVIANVSASANTSVTLPNADVNDGRTIEVRWWDPDGLDPTANVTITIEPGAGNIYTTGSFTADSFNITSNDYSVKLLSNGNNWFRLQQTSVPPSTSKSTTLISVPAYRINTGDYFVLGNTSSAGNIIMTLPNATVSNGQEVVVRLWDPDNSDPTANITVNVEIGAGNIWTTDRAESNEFYIYGSSANVTSKFLSDGIYWYTI